MDRVPVRIPKSLRGRLSSSFRIPAQIDGKRTAPGGWDRTSSAGGLWSIETGDLAEKLQSQSEKEKRECPFRPLINLPKKPHAQRGDYYRGHIGMQAHYTRWGMPEKIKSLVPDYKSSGEYRAAQAALKDVVDFNSYDRSPRLFSIPRDTSPPSPDPECTFKPDLSATREWRSSARRGVSLLTATAAATAAATWARLEPSRFERISELARSKSPIRGSEALATKLENASQRRASALKRRQDVVGYFATKKADRTEEHRLAWGGTSSTRAHRSFLASTVSAELDTKYREFHEKSVPPEKSARPEGDQDEMVFDVALSDPSRRPWWEASKPKHGAWR